MFSLGTKFCDPFFVKVTAQELPQKESFIPLFFRFSHRKLLYTPLVTLHISLPSLCTIYIFDSVMPQTTHSMRLGDNNANCGNTIGSNNKMVYNGTIIIKSDEDVQITP